MKISTTKQDTLKFNGNCKDTRIRKANLLTGDVDRIVHKVIASRGIYDSDSVNVRRYARAIKQARSSGHKLKVTDNRVRGDS